VAALTEKKVALKVHGFSEIESSGIESIYHFISRAVLIPQEDQFVYRYPLALPFIVQKRFDLRPHRVIQLRVLLSLRGSLHHIDQQATTCKYKYLIMPQIMKEMLKEAMKIPSK